MSSLGFVTCIFNVLLGIRDRVDSRIFSSIHLKASDSRTGGRSTRLLPYSRLSNAFFYGRTQYVKVQLLGWSWYLFVPEAVSRDHIHGERVRRITLEPVPLIERGHCNYSNN